MASGKGREIWNEWEADENGYYKGSDGIEKKLGKKFAHTIGTAYGWIVNRFKLTQNLIETLKNKPTDRRMVLNLFQNQFMPTACLPSCVFCSEWDVTDGKLNLLVHCRSNDVPLGLPFNITQYAAFLKMIAHCTDLKPGKFLYTTKDAHIYVNQIEGIKQQIADYKQDGDKPAPKFWINPEVKDFFAFDNSRELKDFAMQDYEPQRAYSFLVAK